MILTLDKTSNRYAGSIYDFSGGMHRRVDNISLQPNQYALGQNVRARFGNLEPIDLPALQMKPAGMVKMQGLYSAGNYLILFGDGKAYYRDASISDVFTQIVGFSMNPDADRIYAQLIPASSINYKRQSRATTSDNVAGAGVDLGDTITPSPAAMVCQDGSSQPVFIFPDASTRVVHTYGEWTTDDREYIPIGTIMTYASGILWVLAPDGKSIYRSCKNRPADFVVNVDMSGEKGGDASTTSHAVDYESVTALNALDITTGAIFIASPKQSYITTPTTGRTVFGEPTFIDAPITQTGPLNEVSLCDINGTKAFIDISGLRSFNAVTQDKWEGQNSPFSAEVSPFFTKIDQTITAAINFDDYALFAVNTIHGQAILVFDNISEQYVSIDIFEEIDDFILQFAVVKTSTLERRIFARTATEEIYELLAGEKSSASVYLGDFSSGDPRTPVRPESLFLQFTDVVTAGTLTVKAYCDGKYVKTFTRTSAVVATDRAEPPVELPFGASAKRNTSPITIQLDSIPNAWRYGFWVSWDFHANLNSVQTIANALKGDRQDRG